jgi:DNA-nicking Smr family endonuclease
MTGKKHSPQDDSPQDDSELFRQAMADTNRIHQRYREERHLPQESTTKPSVKIRGNQLAEPAPSSSVLIDETSQGDSVLFVRGGLQNRVVRKLKRGEFGFSEILDLHGRTTAQSDHDLSQFLAESIGDGLFAVLIIHGKGLHSVKSDSESDSGQPDGVLKQFTVNWLKRQSRVMAFCSALPRDGGTGALYVLLRVKTAC